MKLYVNSKLKNKKIYLSLTANSKQELANKLGNQVFNFGDGENFHVNDVIAEPESNVNGGIGAAIGGFIGLLGGPTGVLIGASLGGILGNSTDNSEKTLVDYFNKNRLW